MATTSKLAPDYEDTGKMIISGPEITNVVDLQSTNSNKTIEVIVYRKRISKHNKTHQPTRYCCILIDKQGTPIQANMDVNDAEYFDQLLQIHTTYRISGFSCKKTCPWEGTLENNYIGRRYYKSYPPKNNRHQKS